MENIIRDEILKVFNVEDKKVKVESRLLGGMSNYTYVVSVEDKKYTFRIPGKNASAFVDRVEEQDNINRIRELDLNNETLYLNLESGYKIAHFVEGTPLSEKDPLESLDEVSVLLKTLHSTKIRASKDYNPLKRLEKYEDLVKDFGKTYDEKYSLLKEKFLSHFDFLDSNVKVFCHNDSQPSNFVVGEKNYLLDWEFGGNNDPLYDVACYGNMDFNHGLALLPVYLGREPRLDELKRVYLWRVFQCLQWHNVALYKDLIGLSKDLKLDFNMIAGLYLTKVETLFEGFENL